MAFTLVSDIVAMVINELSQVPGVVTQKYSTPIITQYIQTAYLLEIDDQWWPDYMVLLDATIDGTTGHLTSDLQGPISSIEDMGDIMIVWVAGTNQRLRALRPGTNPGTVTVGGAANPLYMIPDSTVAKRPFRVLPPTGIGPLKLWARQKQSFPFSLSTKVGIDALLLMLDAAWQYCVNDGTIPAQVAKYELLIRKRRTQVVSSFNQQPIPLDNRFAGMTNEWQESWR